MKSLCCMLACCWLLVVAGSGCGNQRLGAGNTEVKGLVTLDGVPLTDGTVSFAPLHEGNQTGTGSLNDKGEYTLRVSETITGLPAGDYKVAIIAWEIPPGMDEKGQPTKGFSKVPQKYFDANQSGLTATVTTAGPNVIDFALQTEPESETE